MIVSNLELPAARDVADLAVIRQLEVGFRAAGGALQLLGILAVALGISRLRRSFGMSSALAEIAGESRISLRNAGRRLMRLFGWKPKPVVVTVAGAMAMFGGAESRGRGTVGPAPDASLEHRVKLLEDKIDTLQNAEWRLEDDLNREIEERKQALAAERDVREDAHTRLDTLLKEVAVGGIRLQIVGVIWLFMGVALATGSQEFARLFAVLMRSLA